METVNVLMKLQFLFLLQFVQVDTKVMETVIVLLHLNLSYVILDLLVMDRVVVFQLLFLSNLLVQVIISLTEKETAFQIRIQKSHALADLPLMEKEIASGFLNLQFLHLIHLSQLLNKYLLILMFKSLQLHLALQDLILTDSETVLLHQFLYFVEQDM